MSPLLFEYEVEKLTNSEKIEYYDDGDLRETIYDARPDEEYCELFSDFNKKFLRSRVSYKDGKYDNNDKLDFHNQINYTAFYEALLEAKAVVNKGVKVQSTGTGDIERDSSRLSYIATVQGNGNLLIGVAYTSLLDLQIGDQFKIHLDANQIRLTPAEAGEGDIEKGGTNLSYIATVQGNGNLLIAKAYTDLLDLKPGDNLEIKFGRKQIRLIPAEKGDDGISKDADEGMPLTGQKLIQKIKELGDISKSDLVRECGYVSTKDNGDERLNYTAFYEALLEAKGVCLEEGGLENDEEEPLEGPTDSEGFLSSPLGKAFTRLNKEGIRAHGECGYTQSEAAYLISADGYEGPWVCFTSQDQDGLLQTYAEKGTRICCGIEPSPEDEETYAQLYNRVVKILNEVGITCDWDGDLNTRIYIEVNYNHNVYLRFFDLFRAACFDDANLYMLASIADRIDEDFDWIETEEDCISTFNDIFNSSQEDLKKECIDYFKSSDDFNLYVPKDEYSSEEEFLEELDWDEIFRAIHEYCDEQTIREKLARCLEKNIEEIDFKKTVKIDGDK